MHASHHGAVSADDQGEEGDEEGDDGEEGDEEEEEEEEEQRIDLFAAIDQDDIAMLQVGGLQRQAA